MFIPVNPEQTDVTGKIRISMLHGSNCNCVIFFLLSLSLLPILKYIRNMVQRIFKQLKWFAKQTYLHANIVITVRPQMSRPITKVCLVVHRPISVTKKEIFTVYASAMKSEYRLYLQKKRH